DEMLVGAFTRMVRKGARVAEGVELRIVPYQLANGGSRVRKRQPKCNFTDDVVTRISPSPGTAAECEENQYGKRQTTHLIPPIKQSQLVTGRAFISRLYSQRITKLK